MIESFIVLIGTTFGALLPITNPFSTAPVFATLTRGMSRAHRRQQARSAIIYTAAVLLVSLLAGLVILEFFGISISALRVTGGLIVARIGFGMLNPAAEPELPEEDAKEVSRKDDIAFVPIAMPLLSGPGSIAVTISMATAVNNLIDYVAIGIGILLVSAFAWVVLRSSEKIVDLLGSTGVNILTRIMGLILIGIGIQFIAIGIVGFLTDGPIADALNKAYPV